jgi:hypothetical protein
LILDLEMLVNDVVKEPKIRKAWKNNEISSTILVSIPSELAHKYGIKAGSNLVIEERQERCLLRQFLQLQQEL